MRDQKERGIDVLVLVQPNGLAGSLAIHPYLNCVTENESVQVFLEEQVGGNDGIGETRVTRHGCCN